MTLDHLIALFERTHAELRERAAKSVDTALVVRNWLFGWYITEFEKAGASRSEVYGKELMSQLAARLTERLGKGFSRRSLDLFRQFYECYADIWQTLSSQSRDHSHMLIGTLFSDDLATEARPPHTTEALTALEEIWQTVYAEFPLSWSHYVVLLTIPSEEERRFYEIEARENGWGIRELKRQVDASLYERLALSRDKAKVRELSAKGQLVGAPGDIIKSPYVLEFLGLDERASYSEHELETALIDKLEHFLLELGKGFLFEARQKRFTFDDDHFYVDLVFYNRLLRCYVLIDLKRGKLTHQDLGQMQMYVNYFDRHVRLEDENPTVGIILCRTRNDALVELTLPEGQKAVYARQYQLYLPDKAVLRQRLVQWSKELEERPPEP